MKNSRYVSKKKEIQEKILRYIEDDNEEESSNDEQFQDLLQYFKDPTKYHDYIGSHKEILIMINNIANNHQRTPKFFQKIKKLLIEIQAPIKKNMSSTDIFISFKNNKQILLFLIQKKIIEIDQQMVDRLLFYREKNRHYQQCMAEYLFPEIQPFLRKKDHKSISGKIYYIEKIDIQNPANIPLFEKERLKGENPRTICELIREDSVEKFIEYVTKNCIQLNGRIQRSIFETNPLLNKRILPTLIEYAAFYGSVKIFNFLRMNNVKVQPSLMKFAIHSNNADMIHHVEEFVDKEDLSVEYFNQLSFDETLKCHSFHLSEYFKNNFVSDPNLDKSVKWLNYEYFPTTINKSVFYYICKNDIYKLFYENRPSDYSSLDKAYQVAIRMNNVDVAEMAKITHCRGYYGFNVAAQEYRDVINIDFLGDQQIVDNRYLWKSPYVTKLVIYNKAKSFEPNIFTQCPHLEEIVFEKPASFLSLNNGVFYGMVFLKVIEIPASVKSIGNFAFGKCKALKKITFEYNSSLVSIGECCFFECSALEDIAIPSSVNKIGKNIFEKCTSLAHAAIPVSLQNEVTKEYLLCPEQTKIDYH
ncbi:hypothetical protein M9Y10_031058 [Tritrichomonas musculus]|uniref:DUF3447 domain-containing protein n=1 Tax=Tritrichomonas musculus TaxID=1915356 RepID=A0ABR2H1T5_9EUKA